MDELSAVQRENLEDYWRRSRDANRRAPTRTVLMVAGSAFVGWIVALPIFRALAQLLYRPHGVQGFWWLVLPTWNLFVLIPVVAVCCAAAVETRRRGALSGAVLVLVASLPMAYLAYAGFAANERDLSAHLWTASAMDWVFATMAMYPAGGLGALLGVVITYFLPGPGARGVPR